ncbi:MAG: hypothetical protein FK734_08770 [Asgard group archaeon]|nr:hypothetical protein [Asgard group archaeon]
MVTKYIGITGAKKSGKTTTIEFLAPKLSKKGFNVGTVKLAFKDVKLDVEKEHYDVERQRKTNAAKTMFKSKSETTIFYNESMSLRSALFKFGEGLDIVLIEGSKEDLIGYPHITLLKEEDQEKEFVNEYTTIISSIPEFSINNEQEKYIPFEELVEAVILKALPLFPELNCEHCGFKSCNELMQQVIQGNKTIHDCYVIENEDSEVILEINNQNIPCNPFVRTIIKNVMGGFLSSLKLEIDSLEEANIKINFKGQMEKKE